jgi:hypothetical protein
MEDLKKIKQRINWICDNKVNAFSPTISPAFKSKERNEIESILEAVKYFVKHDQLELVFQKKYMGSYCDIYLHKQLQDTFLVSRNAHKITHINHEQALEALATLHAKSNWDNTSLIIIQSELLPWHVLGKGLIENDFNGYRVAHEQHYQYLQDQALYKKIQTVQASEAYTAYIADKAAHTPKELIKLYPSHVIRQYDAIANFKMLDMAAYRAGLDTYTTQFNHFAQEGDIRFAPFNILKKVFDDGTEEFVNDNMSYALVNDDEFKTLTINPAADLEIQLQPIYDWYNSLCSALEEGIMIKPRKAFVKGLAPALKVRNNNYLTLIYGVDFSEKYDEYFGKRNIKRKLECSINDWMLNWELLKTPYKKIHKENYAYMNIVLDRILGEQIENNLDHRL